MDREIKFRAWVAGHWLEDCNNGPMWYDFQNSMHWEFYEEVELMQYTTQKDKNGTEIYEADIIRHEKTGAIGEVVWYGAGWGIVWYPGTNKASYNSLDMDRHYEVIGNKFQNPELLDQ